MLLRNKALETHRPCLGRQVFSRTSDGMSVTLAKAGALCGQHSPSTAMHTGECSVTRARSVYRRALAENSSTFPDIPSRVQKAFSFTSIPQPVASPSTERSLTTSTRNLLQRIHLEIATASTSSSASRDGCRHRSSWVSEQQLTPPIRERPVRLSDQILAPTTQCRGGAVCPAVLSPWPGWRRTVTAGWGDVRTHASPARQECGELRPVSWRAPNTFGTWETGLASTIKVQNFQGLEFF